MTEATGLRARKKLRTRQTIERVALELFEEQGFEATTIDQIAAGADIAPRTFFHYFDTKEDVVIADYTARLQQIVTALETGPNDQEPWVAIRQAFLGAAVNYETERDYLLRRFRIIAAAPTVAARNLQLQANWEDAVTEAVVEWLDVDAATDIRPRLIAGAALAAMRASLRLWLADNGTSRLPDHVTRSFDLLETGLGAITRRV